MAVRAGLHSAGTHKRHATPSNCRHPIPVICEETAGSIIGKAGEKPVLRYNKSVQQPPIAAGRVRFAGSAMVITLVTRRVSEVHELREFRLAHASSFQFDTTSYVSLKRGAGEEFSLLDVRRKVSAGASTTRLTEQA